jgi:hypothetical protein
VKTIGFLGKPNISESEEAKLVLLGRIIARSRRTLVIVPAKGSTAAVEVGVKAERGLVRRITGGVLTESAHSLVYADERLLTRLREAYPAITEMPNVRLMFSEMELDMALGRLSNLLEASGIVPPR